jgi:formyltetrahydrofolate deformylase
MLHNILIKCPDEMGIIHRASGVFLRHKLNIEELGEHIDVQTQQFFMRAQVKGECEPHAVRSEMLSLLPQGAAVRVCSCSPKDIVIMASSEYHCLGDLLIRHFEGELNARVLAVVSNHEKMGALVEKFGIPFHFVPHQGKSQQEHEELVLSALEAYDPAYLVLAKYMRILSPAFVERFPERIINIHHSFLPAFVGAKPYHRAFERGVKIIGATAHFVTEDLDEGPIIAQDVIPVDHGKSVKAMIQAGRNVEKIVLSHALKMVLEDRVFVQNNRTIIFE